MTISNNSHIRMPKNHMEDLYSSKNPFVKYIHNNRLKYISNLISSGSSSKILDAGCGEGQLIEILNKKHSNNQYFGIDITEDAIKSAKIRCPFANISQGDLSKIDYSDCFFDTIICTEVLEHIYDYKKVLNELNRVLKKSGELIITFPNEVNCMVTRLLFLRKQIRIPDHVNFFKPNIISSNLDLKLVSQKHIPFGISFSTSLICVMKFKKTGI